jgi:glycerol uptake facilitator-like aquaporin
MPFRFWSFDHWMNFVIFLAGAVLAVGITAATQWQDLPKLFTPAIVLGFVISTAGFLKASVTNAARNPDIGTRSTDPNPTERVVQVGQATIPVPPVTPGRPVESPKEP